jgi:hypothetical protein
MFYFKACVIYGGKRVSCGDMKPNIQQGSVVAIVLDETDIS